MDMGVFIPIGNNGWLISATSPQYKPSFDLNKAIVQKAEGYGLDFALSMIKLRGFGGETEFWDYNLESFTLMSGLAAVTKKIKLFASVAVLTLPPAIVARMAVTIDSIAPGRFGVNIVSGWAKAEYEQTYRPGTSQYYSATGGFASSTFSASASTLVASGGTRAWVSASTSRSARIDAAIAAISRRILCASATRWSRASSCLGHSIRWTVMSACGSKPY